MKRIYDLYSDSSFVEPAIQIVNSYEKRVTWHPGRKTCAIPKNLNGFIGFTGRIYETYTKPMGKQSYEQHWIGIDIDAKDNPELDKKRVCEILPDARVRTSRSGNGLHALFKLEKPVLVPAGRNINQAITKNLQKYRDALSSSGIIPCSAHSLNFYLVGGKNEWVSDNDKTIQWADYGSDVSYCVGSGKTYDIETMSLEGKEFWHKLIDAGVVTLPIREKYSVVSKNIYKALKNTSFEFSTKSPMQNDEYNGFIHFNGQTADVIINADSGCVLTVDCGGF